MTTRRTSKTVRVHTGQLCLLSDGLMQELTVAPGSSDAAVGCDGCGGRADASSCPRCAEDAARLERLLVSSGFDLDDFSSRVEVNLSADLPLTGAEIMLLARAGEQAEIGRQRSGALLEQMVSRRLLERVQDEGATVPNERLRALVLARVGDPTLPDNLTTIARHAGFRTGTEMGRQLGVYATQVTRRGGRSYGGEIKIRIDRGAAERIARAIGLLPADVDRL
jgi:hypothetical protein